MKKPLIFAISASLALSLPGCAGLGALAGAIAGPPPQAPVAVLNISRNALDFALNSFDAALYGLDFAMDAGKLQPGSPTAKKIASAGRKVMNFLGVAEAARDLGSSATYEEAFGNAKKALDEFRSLLPGKASLADHRSLTNAQRLAVLDRLETGAGPSI